MATQHSQTETDSTLDDGDEGTDGEAETTAPDASDPDETNPAAEDEADPYVIRPYEPGDREDFLDLYEQVLGSRDEEWFSWKYEDNPYTDHVPMIVATHDGTVVGTKPCFALELRAESTTFLGLQPADVMVHPDHRRRGLYSRTTEQLKDRYRDREAGLFFNFPNPATLSGSLKHGWQIVEEVPTYYRIQRPDAMLDADDDRLAALSKTARPFATAYHRAREALAGTAADVTVNRFDDVPVEQFVGLYEQAVPGTIHAHRDETFYEWRFENPRWEYDAYVATRHGKPLAGVVTGTKTENGSKTTSLTDVVPLGATPHRRDGLHGILERVIADHRDADIVAASGRSIPPELLARFGFRSDQSLPLSELAQGTTQVTYPLADDGGHEWTVAGRAVADPANWSITFAEQDTW
ncbi:GNAT family N-acetyltransferase [Natronorubrum sp. JWXQ-INN-674]|uniref:GNAT family N-acetyltransferase n=1 Tax=Natronorubrum halalkaliphilum TaxID=2691917 RepID=A0A6B0VRQ8_9EURY|nr:GNAT family N-acetyltransferase [Natronorubrum halalkaliphilum]MXV63823.1 GNAT family N-acetyltransferase [Natronorubrum halalkaliphilum]